MRRYIPVIIANLIWIWPVIFIKILSFHFDNLTQNFYRYLAASIVLIVVNLAFYKKEFLTSFKNIQRFILPTILIFMFQIISVAGIYRLTPAIVVFINKSSVLFVILFSFIFFYDERRIIRSKAFISGSLLSIIGLIGVIIGKGNLQFDFNLGVILILISAILWALYVLAIKRIVKETNPFVSASIVFTLCVPLFFMSSLFFGNIQGLSAAPKGIVVLLFLSGIFCVGIANAFNYRSIHLIGAAISSNFNLITPFFTAIASYFILKEVLTLYQILSGIVLIIGCAILLSSRSYLKRASA